MKKIFLLISLLVWSVSAIAQGALQKIPQRLEIVTVDLELGDEGSFLSTEENLEVFNMPIEGVNHYFLSVGHLGIGDDVIQFNINPLFELFIPLGDSLSEAQEYLLELQALYKGPKGKSIEIEGCLALGYPNGDMEKVRVTYQKVLLTNVLEFRVERQDCILATHIPKTEFGSLVRGLKIYRKLHKKEL